MKELRGRTAVVTGGASGIGLASARRLAAEGMQLVLADVEAAPLERAAAELGALGVRCDVGDRAQVEALAERAFERFGAVHVVFHNAGVAVAGPTIEMKHADWEWLLRVNLWGPIHGVEAFLPRMVAQGQGGHVLFTASFAGLVPNVGLGVYCVTKYGVVALAEVLQKELRPHGIGVSVLCPMRVATNIARSERNRPRELGGPEASPPVQDQSEDNPDLAGRVLPVETVAEQVVDAIRRDRLYILPHEEIRGFVRRRFERIDRTFEETP
ncbi:MAG TPA: SDR family NAD(P)-dependent oxidoreductase [Myxococcota bacterium]|nr:SDR family NAD(P)-dependent oxidoreductase [Myxococcota bacterium]